MTTLAALGYGPFFSQQLDPSLDPALAPARVLADLGVRLLLGLEGEERLAHLPVSLRGQAAVGDWVLCQALGPGEAVLRRVLSRRSALSRQAAGDATAQQVLAANVDRVLVVQGLDGPVNPRRLERTLAAVRASGAAPAVLLTKADRCPDLAEALAEAEAAAPGVPVLAVAAKRGEGLEAVVALLEPGATTALLGPSGAGKSTLVNALLGDEVAAVGELLADGRGRHTTTHRRLWRLPGGGLLVDGPGLRELQLWGGEGVAAAFGDVAALAAGCRFADCAHAEEPGCAVVAAVEAGTLDELRFESYHKLAREAAALAARHDTAARQAATRETKVRHRALRDFQRRRGR
ncbi:MAG: ribosome small subunit-dependent GTPase A [Anaeromyxobacter sp.]|nr:ribosome small subunit-dependent GTPase A [Anaeromyxobacter sp.]MBL0274601.1 ribosome small subunit-dependent GTPase A [Anaeromyxobacter sp.]